MMHVAASVCIVLLALSPAECLAAANVSAPTPGHRRVTPDGATKKGAPRSIHPEHLWSYEAGG